MAGKKIDVEITATDKASSKLDKVEKKADRLEADPVDIDLDVDTADLDRAESKIAGLVTSMSGPAGVAAGAGALAAGLFAAADAAANMAIDAQVTANLTGATVEDASRLQVVWKQTGADVNDLNDILLNMNSVLADSPDLAGQLGVNLADGASGVDRLLGLLDELNTSQLSANEKARIMGQLFGEEGVRQMGKLLVMFPDLEAAMDDVNDKQVITAEQVENAREFAAQLAEAKNEGAGLAATLGSVLLPVLSGLLGFLNTGITTFEDWGRAVRVFVDSGAAANHELVAAFNASEDAAANFDTKLLEGLTTFEQVRQKVFELTGDYHAANTAALAWLGTTQDIGTAMGVVGGVGHAPAAGFAAIIETNADRRAALTAPAVTIFNPPGTPAATADQLGTYRVRNSSRTDG